MSIIFGQAKSNCERRNCYLISRGLLGSMDHSKGCNTEMAQRLCSFYVGSNTID